jgi:hypothetical protein
VYRLDEDEEVASDDSRDASKSDVQRAARLLGLSPGQLGLQGPLSSEQCAEKEKEKGVAWGFGGATAGQRVGAALRCFLRFEGEMGGVNGDPGRDAARLLLAELALLDEEAVDEGASADLCLSPVHMLSHGALGAEVAAVVSAAMDAFSASTRAAGLKALQQCVLSEKMRVRRGKEAVFSLAEETPLGEDCHGGDEVRDGMEIRWRDRSCLLPSFCMLHVCS